jgi:23S rRNA (guanosine2251-2'-O)-methyltransferase
MQFCEDLGSTLRELKGQGTRILGTSSHAQEGYLGADCAGPVCWVLGSEGSGMSQETMDTCDKIYRIPYPGTAESLNASVAGAILLFEVLRQRGGK